MSKKQDFTKQLIGFIDLASEIGEMCSDNFAHHSADDFLSVKLHDKYITWKMGVADFLRDRGLVADSKLFAMENAVPLMKGGVAYSDRNSELSISLRRTISAELADKLKHLGELLQREAGRALGRHLALNFFFELQGGKLYRHKGSEDESCRFTPTDGRYKILKILIEEKDKGSHWVKTDLLSHKSGYKHAGKCRSAIGEIRKKIEDAFEGVRGDEFIESEQDSGYRIGHKITIIIQDTP